MVFVLLIVKHVVSDVVVSIITQETLFTVKCC